MGAYATATRTVGGAVMVPLLLLLVWCLVASAHAAASKSSSSSPPIQVQLRAPWTSPPLVLEILEAAYEEEPSSFFTLLSHLTSPWAFDGIIKGEKLNAREAGHRLQQASDDKVHAAADRILEERGLLQQRGQRDNFQLSLALKSQTPKIEAFWQLYQTSGLQQRWESRQNTTQEECGSWVDFAGQVICSDEELIHALEGHDTSKTYTLTPGPTPFDHVFTSSSVSSGGAHPFSSASAPTAVLYADPFSLEFWSLHKRLTEYALGARTGENALRYILRWKPLQKREKEEEGVYLAGYGAYLDLKKVDYLVIDDRKLTDTAVVEGSDGEGKPNSATDAAKKLLADQDWLSKQLKTTKEDEEQTIGSLEEAELANLATRGAYVVAKSKEPLRALRQLSQDFPKHGVALARSAPNPSKSFVSELAHHHEVSMQSGANDVWLNGKLISAKDFQPLGLLPILRSERAIVNALTSLNLSTDDALSLLTSPVIGQAYTPDDSNAPFFDASDRIEREMSSGELEAGQVAAIAYWNDIEKEDDPRYARWGRELKSVLRPLYPGSFPVIQRNLFNLILVMDLEKLETCKFLSDTVSMATSRIAIRWGFVPSNLGDSTSASAQLTRLFWLVFDQVGPEKTGKYLRRVVAASTASTEGKIEVATAEKEAAKMLKMDLEEINALISGKYTERERLAQHYVQRLRADEHPQGHAFVNGQHMPFGPHIFQFLHQAISAQIQIIGPAIYYGQVEEDADVSTYFYDLPGVYSSRSELIFPPEETVIKTTSVEVGQGDVKNDQFVYPATSSQPNSTVWVAGDLDSEQGARLIRDVVTIMDEANVRLGFIHQPVPSSSAQPSLLLSTFLYQLLSSPAKMRTSTQLLGVLETYKGKEDNLHEATSAPEQVVLDDAAAINKMKSQSWSAPEADLSSQYWQDAGGEMKTRLSMESGTYALVINGKVVSGFTPSKLSSTDYKGLFQKEAAKVDAVVAILGNMTTVSTDLAAQAASVLEKAYFVDASLEGIFDAPSKTRNMIMDQLIFKETIFTIGDKKTASLRFSVLLDPVTEMAQKWSSVLEMLADMEDVYIQVILNPTPVLRELPIKRYYRYSAPSRLAFSSVSGRAAGEKLEFQDMPLDAVLTMGLDAPPSWLTMASDAIYDLDNIRLKDVVTPVVSATYDLKYILIEGHVRDEVVKATPRGLQIVLETIDGSEQLDTIVMANLAYFQFRTRPGLYRLRLRPGRSTDLFDMVSVGNAGMDSPRVEVTGDGISLTTLQGLTVYPRIAKKKGREREILVEEEGEVAPGGTVGGAAVPAGQTAGSIFGKAKGFLSSLTNSVKSSVGDVTSVGVKSKQADINVFTVASGHLYERMTYIMILSTLKHTNQTVKFWFIENFLSPSFKDFIPHLAEEYKFDYELVTYAWPHWLRSQKEKQREIWGMKVLFLDVIFPLDLSKVIFVDADQIVRADLQELIDTDLQGAPYGFPPMGNDSYDMDNFRFWEQPGGYWERFLNGKPYPISALYVVDLNKFRLQAAGDKLRGNYQALTQDPNSLSNLDQDLVASMIHVVNIHSLEKEWLWCETWCSWDWYDKAKSIDLCSNPKTKEPKLDRAKRQIPEWSVLDEEVAQVAKKFKEEGKLGANVVAPVEISPKAEEEETKVSHDEL